MVGFISFHGTCAKGHLLYVKPRKSWSACSVSSNCASPKKIHWNLNPCTLFRNIIVGIISSDEIIPARGWPSIPQHWWLSKKRGHRYQGRWGLAWYIPKPWDTTDGPQPLEDEGTGREPVLEPSWEYGPVGTCRTQIMKFCYLSHLVCQTARYQWQRQHSKKNTSEAPLSFYSHPTVTHS